MMLPQHFQRTPERQHRGVFISTLAHHALVEIRCDHERRLDLPVCNCAVADLGWHGSVQAAKEAWAAHVWEALGARTS
jgi:hypothetical protein